MEKKKKKSTTGKKIENPFINQVKQNKIMTIFESYKWKFIK